MTGGLSGPAIKPITLRLAYEANRAVKIPIIGLGGIEKAEEVLEYMMVGAAAVQIGTASFSSPAACERIVQQLERLCITNKARTINKLVGELRADFA